MPINFLSNRSGRLVSACIFGAFSSVAFRDVSKLLMVTQSHDLWGPDSTIHSMGMMVRLGRPCAGGAD